MMKENEDGVVHLVVGEDSFALCTRSSVRRGEGQKNGKRMVRVGQWKWKWEGVAPIFWKEK